MISFLCLFGAMVAVAVAKRSGVIENDVARRFVGIILGLMLICAGNVLPKFRLFESGGSDPAKALAAGRFAGWTFVLAGAAYVVFWRLAPMPRVTLLSSIVGLSAFALVGMDLLRRTAGARSPRPRPTASESTLVKRLLLGTILLSLGWGIAIFLVDHFWGDTASMWMGVIWSIVIPSVIGLATPQPAGESASIAAEMGCGAGSG
jgi:hypothetical protein